MDIADEWLSKFGDSDHSHPLWREAKTNSKLLSNLHDELTSEIHNVDEMEVGANEKLGVLQVVVKKIYIAMKILSAFTAGCNSAYSSLMLTAIDEMQLLMTLEPVVDDFPWPKFLLQVQHESKIAGITEVGEFWAMLDERKLSSAGYIDAADGQCNLIRNRLCDMQRKISAAGVSKHAVTDLAKAIAKIFDMSIFTAVLKNSLLAKQCRSIIMMSSFVESTMDKQLQFVAEDLEQIESFIKDDTSVFTSFTSTPVGRQYIADFQKCHAACRIFFRAGRRSKQKSLLSRRFSMIASRACSWRNCVNCLKSCAR